MGNGRIYSQNLVAIVSALALLSCGGSDKKPSASVGDTLIQATACSSAFAACGGDITGTWKYSAACIEGDFTAAINSAAAAGTPACSTMYTASAVAAKGTGTFTSGNYTQQASIQFTEQLSVTQACFAALSGGVTLDANMCAQFQQQLVAQSGGGTASCSYASPNCNCTATITHPSPTSGTYTTSGNTLTQDGTDSFDYCVNGSTLTVHVNIVTGANVYLVIAAQKG
jgi:hypothetical protein